MLNQYPLESPVKENILNQQNKDNLIPLPELEYSLNLSNNKNSVPKQQQQDWEHTFEQKYLSPFNNQKNYIEFEWNTNKVERRNSNVWDEKMLNERNCFNDNQGRKTASPFFNQKRRNIELISPINQKNRIVWDNEKNQEQQQLRHVKRKLFQQCSSSTEKNADQEIIPPPLVEQQRILNFQDINIKINEQTSPQQQQQLQQQPEIKVIQPRSTNQLKLILQKKSKKLKYKRNQKNKLALKIMKQKESYLGNEEQKAPLVSCNCKKSQCLKLYCDCFQSGKFCNENCKCYDCKNLKGQEVLIEKQKQKLLNRNPSAFNKKVIIKEEETSDQKTELQNKVHAKGCKCNKSGCTKKYCECYQAGIPCSLLCKCENCKNQLPSQVKLIFPNKQLLKE